MTTQKVRPCRRELCVPSLSPWVTVRQFHDHESVLYPGDAPLDYEGLGRGRLLSVHLSLGAGSNLATRHAVEGQQEHDCSRQHVNLPALLPRIGLSRTVTPQLSDNLEE